MTVAFNLKEGGYPPWIFQNGTAFTRRPPPPPPEPPPPPRTQHRTYTLVKS